jgi:hypothetical protein
MKKTTLSFAGVTIALALIATSLSRIFWPDLPGAPAPSAAQLPFLVGIGILDSLAFGLGIAFLVFGFRRALEAGWQASAAFFATVWFLVSWWPHDNLHRVTPEGDYWSLIALEYGFHATLMIAAAFIAYYLWKRYKEPYHAPHVVMHPTLPQ